MNDYVEIHKKQKLLNWGWKVNALGLESGRLCIFNEISTSKYLFLIWVGLSRIFELGPCSPSS